MQLFLNILGGMINSVDPDQTAPSGSGSALFFRYFSIQNFRTFTIHLKLSIGSFIIKLFQISDSLKVDSKKCLSQNKYV